MLNINRVVNYIKGHLAFPFMHLELEDAQIVEYIKDFSVREFSYYVPQVKKMNLNIDLEQNRVPGRQNEFYLNEPEGLEILNVVDVYFPSSDLIFHGHPPLGPLTYQETQQFALDVHMAMTTKMFSSWDRTVEFQHPNILRISPVQSGLAGSITVEYERMQPNDLSGIPNEFQILFSDFCLADIMIMLGQIRRKYTTISTPFGEVPVGTEIYDEGKEKRREVIEKLSLGPLLNVRIDIG